MSNYFVYDKDFYKFTLGGITMANPIILERVTKMTNNYQKELSDLLINIVESEASVGFLPPLNKTEAFNYWKNIVGLDEILVIAKLENEIVGTVQIQMCRKENGKHRAEIAKLMTHPNYQRMGIGRMLMQAAEQIAKEQSISLLVLDTREGDVSNKLYKSIGYIEGGRIPSYALSANGKLDTTIYYYKII